MASKFVKGLATAFAAVAITGGIISTGSGIYDLSQQPNGTAKEAKACEKKIKAEQTCSLIEQQSLFMHKNAKIKRENGLSWTTIGLLLLI